MCKRLIYLVSFVLVLSVASRVQATPFSLVPTFDGHVSNDAQEGPDSSPGGSGMHMRDIGGRRRVGFVTYDLSEVKAQGAVFSNMSFSNYGHDTGTVNVFGVLEEHEDLVAEGITWNTAPGVQNNPTPGLDSAVALDLADVTDILLTFNAPSRGARESTETSQALADLLNSDTNGFVAFMLAPAEGGNAIVRTVEMGENGGMWLEGDIGGLPQMAQKPNPADQATDVPRDVVLSWMPGGFSDKHDVYLGTNFDDVNDATATVDQSGVYMNRQDPNIYPFGGTIRLDFSQTYYWRIDQVSAPPDNTIYKGNVWQFTVEPLAYQIPGENISTSASSGEPDKGPENTINGSGLDESGLLHGNISVDAMWLSSQIGDQPTWIEYEFDKVYKLHEMWVWNSNDSLEQVVGFGFKDVTIEYSVNGFDYTTLETVHEFARAPGSANYAHNTTVDFNDTAVKYIRLTANSNWEEIFNQFGLSEVRFFHIPVHAGEPGPDSGAVDIALDVTLNWRAGREAAEYNLYFSNDEQAVIDGTAPVTTLSQTIYGPMSLDLGKTYYWRVDEVNNVNPDSVWVGDIWSFTTADFLVVDDFESYNDLNPDDPESNRIFNVWLDGFENPANGSVVGYENPPFAEQTNVNNGRQSMPLFYDNSVGYSEAQKTLDSMRDWTRQGVGVLTIWFMGDAANAAEQIYVALNGSAVVSHDNPNAAQIVTWTQWNIDLQAFADQGVNLANVNTIAIGLGNRNNPLAGGSGTMYFDDIRLYPPPPPEP
ncbi:MAG TPA: hypothetical protein VMW72_17290 [Sedimentisphaerales bacterium]|nr:hypothetical protein [Sedimentisphaerales bacterium]